jgi:hypothetical protein
MVAAPFKATLIFRRGSESLTRFATVSDVNAAYYVFQDGNPFLSMPGAGSWVWTDLILSAAGTDTSNAAVYVNGAATPVQIVNSANTYGVLQRQIASIGSSINGGSMLKIVQAT